MSRFSTVRTVPHPASDMFDLVADVEAYPEFVPLCTALKVLSRTPAAADRPEEIVANMTVGYGLVRETFTSRIVLDRRNLAIDVTSSDGPFRSMENDWLFEPMDEDECLVRFAIAYEFRAWALGLMVGAVFDRAFRRFASAFLQRADAVYGRGS